MAENFGITTDKLGSFLSYKSFRKNNVIIHPKLKIFLNIKIPQNQRQARRIMYHNN